MILELVAVINFRQGFLMETSWEGWRKHSMSQTVLWYFWLMFIKNLLFSKKKVA